MIGFIWVQFLPVLALLPVLVWWYRRSLARRGGGTAAHSDSEFLQSLLSPRFARRRDLPAALFGLALVCSVLALARPTAPVPTLDDHTTIMLALDVSGSMRNNDVQPSRFVAAQEAARAFARQLPAGVNLGLVSFAGSAALNTPPTTERESLLSAIDSLFMSRGTAIGAGIRESLGALRGAQPEPAGAAGSSVPTDTAPAFIVLMTDGRNNREPDPLEMAALAQKRGVKVYTIGLGTQRETSNTNPFAGFDPETLRRIAEATGGQYFEAQSAGQLMEVFRSLGRSLGWRVQSTEVTGFVAALSGILLFLSLMASETNRRVV